MKIIAQEKDETTLVPENLNDLWYLYTHAKGKIIWQKTLRTKTICKGGELKKGKKKPVYLGILAEKVSWEGNFIKTTGKIVSGEDKNKHHSLQLELEKKAKIVGHLEKIPRRAKREALVCVADKSRASIGQLRGSKIQQIDEIHSKRREVEFYKEVSSRIKRENPSYILLAGPDKTKDKIYANLTELKNIFLDQVTSTGKPGFEEVQKRSVIKAVFEKQREDREKKAVREVLSQIKKNPEKAIYGLDVGKTPERSGEIIVLSDFVPKYESILKTLEDAGAKINIIDSSKDYAQESRQFELIGLGRW